MSDSGADRRRVGSPIRAGSSTESPVPLLLTGVTWALFVASVIVAVARPPLPELAGSPSLLHVDGLTRVMWVAVTLFSGLVQSYSLRYLAGTGRRIEFFAAVFAFTTAVLVLVAADHALLFLAAWGAMGVFMAELIGHCRGWREARAAARYARRFFLASTALLGGGLFLLWRATGEATIAGMTGAAAASPALPLWGACVLLVAAGAVQSALVPFHGWLLSSMTAPTPASALMHAGFVNAGGILLARFAPAFLAVPPILAGVALLGAASAIAGKLFKKVQPGVKGRLGSSTVGQMGFMFLQAGLGFFAAAVTHLILHGFYKGYLFLSSGGRIEARGPGEAEGAPSVAGGVAGVLTTALTAVAAGALFALLTGKGLEGDAGLLLTVLVVIAVGHATRGLVRRSRLPRSVRFVGGPALFLAVTALYAGVYLLVEGAMAGVPALTRPVGLGVAETAILASFGLAYLLVETGAYRGSRRLYVGLRNATRPHPETMLTSRQEYRAS